MSLVWVAIGGAAGACLRAAISAAATKAFGSGFPHALYVVNSAGSLLLGLFVGGVDPVSHAALIAGLCGALTTYSTFAHATIELVRAGRLQAALAHIAINMAGSLTGVCLGLWLSGGLRAYQ